MDFSTPSSSSNFGNSSKVWKLGGDGTVHSKVVAPSPHGFCAAAAAQNPWGEGATTLEWTVPSPPNFHTFEELPKFEDEEGVEKSTS